MVRLLLLLLLLPLSVSAETVRFETADSRKIVADFHAGRGDAPTVICLPMYRDVEAAFAFLEKEKGCDPTRMGIVGGSVGCSVAVDTTVRNPHLVRAVVLLTPGSNYLGVPTLDHLRRWPGTRVFTFTSSEEEKTSRAVMDVLAPFDGSNHMVIPGRGIHGTLMFGKVTAIEELIANFMETSLADPVDLRVPRDAPLVLGRKVGEATYSFRVHIEGSRWVLGAEVDSAFRGRLEVLVGEETLVFPLDTARADGRELRAEKGKATARRTPRGLVLEREGLDAGVRLALEFRPESGPSVRLPGGKAPFAARPGAPSG